MSDFLIIFSMLSDVQSSHSKHLTQLIEDSETESSNVCQSPDSVVKHFIMTKIEKTGSTTLHSILARYVLNNDLNVLNQEVGFHIDWTKQTKDHGMCTISQLVSIPFFERVVNSSKTPGFYIVN